MRLSDTCLLAALAHTTAVTAQRYSAYEDEDFDILARDFDDTDDHIARDFLDPRDEEYDSFNLAARSEYDYPSSLDTREYQPQPRYRRRDILLFPNPGPDPMQDLINSILAPRPSPFDQMLRDFSAPAHRDHAHMMMILPQRENFRHFMQMMSQGPLLADSRITNQRSSGFSCSSSMIIGPDGIPHTTKECTTTGPAPEMQLQGNRVFGHMLNRKQKQKMLRSKRILELDSVPHRGTIKSYTKLREGEEVGGHHLDDELDLDLDLEHGREHKKDDKDDKHDDDFGLSKHEMKRAAEAEYQELDPAIHAREAEMEADTEMESLITARDAEAEAEAEAEEELPDTLATREAEAEPQPEAEPEAKIFSEAMEEGSLVTREADPTADAEPAPEPEAEPEPEAIAAAKAEAEAVTEPEPLP